MLDSGLRNLDYLVRSEILNCTIYADVSSPRFSHFLVLPGPWGIFFCNRYIVASALSTLFTWSTPLHRLQSTGEVTLFKILKNSQKCVNMFRVVNMCISRTKYLCFNQQKSYKNSHNQPSMRIAFSQS